MISSLHLNAHTHGNAAEGEMLEKFSQSQPVLKLIERLAAAGQERFIKPGPWEICLAALILKINPRIRIESVLQALPYKSGHMDEADLLNTMAHLGYFSRPADCLLGDIDERLLPGIFIPLAGVPCVVLGRDKTDTLQFYDPVSTLVSAVPPTFDSKGKVWFFQPYDESRTALSRFMRKGSGHSWFRALLGRFGGTFWQIMLAGFFLNLIALAVPIFIMLVYDRVIAAGAGDIMPMLAFGACMIVALEWKLLQLRSGALCWLAGRLDNVVGNRIFSHLIGLPPVMIENASVSSQIARIKTFEAVRDFFSGSVFLSLLEAPFIFLSIGAIALLAGNMIFVPFAMIGAYGLLFWLMRRKIRMAIRIAAKTSSARQQFIIEALEKLGAIRGHGLTQQWDAKIKSLTGREMQAHFVLNWHGLVAETLANAITVIAAVLTVGFGVHMVWAGAMSSGALVATMILVWRVLTPFYSLCTVIPRIEQLRSSIMQINMLMDIKTEAEEVAAYAKLPAIRGAVDFKDVSFRNNDEGDPVFMNLSLSANPGDFIAVTGENGSGKGAVLKLIKSMSRASSGIVYIDGFDIRQLDVQELRRQIAYVSRNPGFFTGTILQNLRMANPLADEAQVRDALERADAWEECEALSDGLNTIIEGSGRNRITSTLAMRLSLARAYLCDASIVLIDDLPNALLTGRTGRNLKDYIARSKGKCTIFMVTYRDDYLRLADRIIWLRGFEAPVSDARENVLPILQKATGA